MAAANVLIAVGVFMIQWIDEIMVVAAREEAGHVIELIRIVLFPPTSLGAGIETCAPLQHTCINTCVENSFLYAFLSAIFCGREEKGRGEGGREV